MPSSLPTFDVVFARSLFPFFDGDYGNWALFDNAGGTLPCGPVVDRLNRFYTHNKVQPYGRNAVSAAAGDQMDEGRRTIAGLLGVPLDTLTFGPSTTQNANTLSIACTGFLQPGDEIVVSEQDHEANIGGWDRAARLSGATFRLWPVDADSGELCLDDLDRLLSPRTKLVCLTRSSNILGTLNPVDAVIERAHAVGARVVVDAVSAAPHQWPDLSDTKADAFLFSTYKTFATHLGILYVAPDFLQQLAPQCHFFNVGKPGAALDAAGPDHASIAALAGLGDFFRALHDHHLGSLDFPPHAIASRVSALAHRHEEGLCARLLDGLEGLPIRVIGHDSVDGREANVALVPLEESTDTLAGRLAEHDIAVGRGHFYAYRLLEKCRVDMNDGVVRISLALYNTKEEIDQLLEAME